jgi:hypothetical protein
VADGGGDEQAKEGRRSGEVEEEDRAAEEGEGRRCDAVWWKRSDSTVDEARSGCVRLTERVRVRE